VPSASAALLGIIAQSTATAHPIRYACERYVYTTATDIRYKDSSGNTEAPAAQQAYSLTPIIVRALLDTGGCVLWRNAEGAIIVRDWTHVQVREPKPYVYDWIVDDVRVVDVQPIVYGAQSYTAVRAPYEYVAQELTLDTIAKRYALQVLANDAYMRRILTPSDGVLDEATIERWRSKLMIEGTHARGTALVMSRPMQVHESDPVLASLDLSRISDIVEATISSVYGVPLQLLGLASSAKHQTYANRQQASRDYTERMLVPLWRRIADAVGALLNVPLEPDLDSVAALRDDYSEYVIKLYNAGIITLGESRELLGWSDETTPAEEQAAPANLITQAAEDNWYEQSQQAYSRVEASINSALQEAYNEIARKLNAMQSGGERITYLYSSEFARDLTDAVKQAVNKHVPAIVDEAYDAADYDGSSYSADPRALARREVARVISQEIEARMSYSIETLRYEIGEQIDSGKVIELDLDHAAMVARTLATGLVAGVQTQVWQAMQRTSKRRIEIRKMWQSMRDERVRDTHQVMDGVIVTLNQDFKVPRPHGSGYDLAAHPADSRMSVSNIVNCRCVVVPRTIIKR
jgi:hypothetical protein